MYKIGIISDTHGLLPSEIYDIFRDVDQIIHAGDIGHEDILVGLRTLAPLLAVYGNMDGFHIRKHTKERLDFHAYGFDFIVTHVPEKFVVDEKPTVCIYGHTHKPKLVKKNRSFLINPGSASQPRNVTERSVATMVISEPGEATAKIIYF